MTPAEWADEIASRDEAIATLRTLLDDARRQLAWWQETHRQAREFSAEQGNRLAEAREALDRIHEAARIDRPDEDKHQLAVRIMALARPPAAPLTMETYEGWKGSDG
jgi:hypothetical protein